jgi:uncharacterized protein (PEP-CTERM system associated)
MPIPHDLKLVSRTVLRACRAGGVAAIGVAAVTVVTSPRLNAGEWLITPRIEVQERFTDNVFGSATDRRSDLITTLAPGIEISGEGARLRGRIDYSPKLYLYALTPDQNTVGHDLFARGTATLVPDLLYFDANAYAAMLPTSPGLATELSSILPTVGAIPATPTDAVVPGVLPRNELSQVTTLVASPYVQRRFGSYGVGEVRYTFANNNFGRTGNGSPTFAGRQDATDITHEGTATFVTGEYFDRFSSRMLLDTSHSSGNGALDGATQHRAIVATEIPLVGKISALNTIGYEDLRFNGVPPVRIQDIVWGIGVRLAPTPDRTLTALYGRHEGITSPYIALNYALTPLTRITASYSDSLSTVAEDIARRLMMADRIRGQSVDARTLLPLEIHNPLVGLQLSLFRIKRLSSAVYVDNKRDHFSLSVNREEDLVVSQSTQPQQAGSSLRATTAGFSWAHDVNPLTTTQVGLGYSWVTVLQQPEINDEIFTFGASISYLFSPTLTGSAGYTFFNRSANIASRNTMANLVFVGLRKTF